jgi:hypothetical protein
MYTQHTYVATYMTYCGKQLTQEVKGYNPKAAIKNIKNCREITDIQKKVDTKNKQIA